MFPDKVGRMIVDGVLNPSEYYAGRYEFRFLGPVVLSRGC
jgi:hypothetical protein